MHIKKIVVNDDSLSKAQEKINERIPEPLPKVSFAMLILAQRQSGKTNLIINMLLQGYKSVFHNVFVFSPTCHSDVKYNAIKLDDEKKFTEYTDEYFQSIIDYQEMEENKNKFALVILDDCVGMWNRNSLINSFITKARWYRISLIFSVQYTKSISPIIRNNITSCIIIGNQVKKEELKKIEEILPENFEKYYKQLKHNDVSKYNFIYINWERTPTTMFNFTNKIMLNDNTLIDPQLVDIS